MQQIERYGVIALVFLLVTIVAVSFWGDSKSPSFWSRLTGKADAKIAQVDAQKPIDAPPHVSERALTDPLPLSAAPEPTPAETLAGGAYSGVPADATVGGAPLTVGGTTSAAPGQTTPSFASAPVTTEVPQTSLAPSTPVATPPEVARELESSDATKAPATSSTTTYVVQKGDSLARIASRTLGSEQRWTEIQALNAGLNPKSLRVGDKLVLPAGAKVAATSAPKAAPKTAATKTAPAKQTPEKSAAATKKPAGKSYVVKRGDNLSQIARRELGDESRWKDIVALNPGLDPEHLVVGKSLRLPASSSALVATNVASTGSDKPRVR